MGYKRRAQVVFLSGHADGLAELAMQWTGQLASSWMEARGMALLSEKEQQVLSDEDLAWADVLVTLDAAALAALPLLPSRVQHRHYPFERNEEDEASLHQRLRARILGMAGGMRLLENAAQMED
jgi:hypothetical protein